MNIGKVNFTGTVITPRYKGAQEIKGINEAQHKCFHDDTVAYTYNSSQQKLENRILAELDEMGQNYIHIVRNTDTGYFHSETTLRKIADAGKDYLFN